MSERTDEELESLWDNADGGVAGANRALYELGLADAKAEVERLRGERDELRAQLQRLTDDAYEVDHRGNYSEPPIESLGPVPLTAGDLAVMSMNDTIGVRTVLRWLVRDAVRRGAELEGE